MIQLCLIAPSGSGKSTAAKFLIEHLAARGLTAGIYKLAEPLYEIQSVIYRKAGREIDFYQQDQVLLEEIATALRRIHPESLVRNFLRRIDQADHDVVINDDLRDTATDYPLLKARGFRFVKVAASAAVRLERLRTRRDLSTITESALDKPIEGIEADWHLDNESDDLEMFRRSVHRFTERLIDESDQP